MRLSAQAFNRHLNGMGQDWLWRRAFACPCVSRESGQPKPKCEHCNGKGRLWTNEATPGVAGVVSQTKLRAYANFGPFDKDDTLLSIPSDSPIYAVGEFDRLRAVNRTEPFSINFIRGLNDTIKFEIVSIERAFFLNAQNAIVDVEAPTLNDNGTLSWPGTAPPAQTSFSLTGRRHPEYFCYLDLPNDRPIHFGEALPRRVIVRRFDLYGR